MKNDYFNTFEPHDFDISEDMELNMELQTIFVPMEPWFDPDKKFGIHVSNDDNAWVNLFADYNPVTGELHVYYNIDTYQNAYEREYIPTDEESELFVNRIEQACMKQNHMNCREFYIREYVEYYADSLKLVCEEKGQGIQIRNTADDFILYYSDDAKDKRFIGDEIELANYGDGECYSIEDVDRYEVIYSTDVPEQELTEFKAREIDKDTFWQMIDESREMCGKFSEKIAGILQKKLESCSLENVKRFCGIYYLYRKVADKDGIADIANTMNNGMLTDDEFIDFRAWLIAQGKDTYFEAMKSPEILAEKSEATIDGYYYFESFGYVGMNAVEKLTGDFMQAFTELPENKKKEILSEIEYGEYTSGKMTPEEIAQEFPKFAKKYIEPDFDLAPENDLGQTMS